MKDLNVAVVGGGSGLGLLLAELSVSRGASGIGVIDLNTEAAETLAESCKPNSGASFAFEACDIRTAAPVNAAFEAIVERLQHVDTLINCAAIYPRKPLLEITDSDWDASNAVNIKGTFHTMVAAVKHMRQMPRKNEIRGRIVNITSVDAFKAHPQNAHYAATKAAVVSLTRSFAHEVAADGILVNSIAPAGMATEQAKQHGFLEELADASPLGRGGTPHEMAEWVLMAGGTRNTYMTGENIIVSGGYIYA